MLPFPGLENGHIHCRGCNLPGEILSEGNEVLAKISVSPTVFYSYFGNRQTMTGLYFYNFEHPYESRQKTLDYCDGKRHQNMKPSMSAKEVVINR